MGDPVSLSHPNAVEFSGVLYVIGLRDCWYWLRRSTDGGASWLPFSDGQVESPVAPATCEQRAGLVKLSGQGAPLLACVPDWPHLAIYRSYDDGETWSTDSQI